MKLFSNLAAVSFNLIFGIGLAFSIVWFTFFLENFSGGSVRFETTRAYDFASVVVSAAWIFAFILYNKERYRYLCEVKEDGSALLFVMLILVPLVLPVLFLLLFHNNLVVDATVFDGAAGM